MLEIDYLGIINNQFSRRTFHTSIRLKGEPVNRNINELWLFDYSNGGLYEEFSLCEDPDNKVGEYLTSNYNLFGKRILEIGSGSGKFTSLLASKCHTVFAVDKSDSLMQINKLKNSSYRNIQYILSNVAEIRLPSKSVDMVFAGWSMTSMKGHFAKLYTLFRRVLKDDGTIVLVENAGGDDFCDLVNISRLTDKMKRLYTKMGFSPRKVINTSITFPSIGVFNRIFPDKPGIVLPNLSLQFNVLVLDMTATQLSEHVAW